jgi:hypothetical protein
VPGTVGDAAALFREKRFPEIAELAALLCEDADLRARVVAAGRERARAFLPEAVLPQLRRLVETEWSGEA